MEVTVSAAAILALLQVSGGGAAGRQRGVVMVSGCHGDGECSGDAGADLPQMLVTWSHGQHRAEVQAESINIQSLSLKMQRFIHKYFVFWFNKKSREKLPRSVGENTK